MVKGNTAEAGRLAANDRPTTMPKVENVLEDLKFENFFITRNLPGTQARNRVHNIHPKLRLNLLQENFKKIHNSRIGGA